MNTSRKHFTRRLKYRLKKHGKGERFALQENIFGNGYVLMLRGVELSAESDTLYDAQIKLQTQLTDFLKSGSFQTTLPTS